MGAPARDEEPPPMTSLGPGSTFSHYRIVDTLGHGGQATAFKAEDLRLNRPVVIKALKPELATSETARRRFEREAALCSAIDNPHIQAVYDVGETDGLYYIVLQYVEGPTLKQFMGGRPLETLSALSIAIQLADALAVAHAAGIAHRDLKPANIIVGPGGQARILDFGLAKMLVPDAGESGPATPSRGTDDPLTEVGVPYGSMGYSSPEQASGQAADHRTDVFSLGVVLYEMVTGQPPFRGRHAVEVLSAVINATPRPITDVNPRALPVLQPILDRALAKSPADRYQTMAAFRDALKALMRRLTRETGVVPTETTATFLPLQRARAIWPFSGTLGRVLGRLRPSIPGLGSSEPGSGPAAVPRDARAAAVLGLRRAAHPRGPPVPQPRREPRRRLLRVLPRRRGHHRARQRQVDRRPPLGVRGAVRGPGRRPAQGRRGAGDEPRPHRRVHPHARAHARLRAARRRPRAATCCGPTRSTSPRGTCSTCRTRSPSGSSPG